MAQFHDDNEQSYEPDTTGHWPGGQANFKITDNASLYPQGNSFSPGKTADFYPGFNSSVQANEDPYKAMQKQLGSISQLPRLDGAFDGKGKSGFYGSNAAETDTLDPEKQKWNWSSKQRETPFQYRPDEPTRNAVLNGMLRTGLVDASEVRQSNPALTNWDAPRTEPAFRAFPENAVKTEIPKHERDFTQDARRLQREEARATGWDAWQTRYQTGEKGGESPGQQVENVATAQQYPVGKVANQWGLSTWMGIHRAALPKTVDLPGNAVNYVSQSFGGKPVMGRFADIGNRLADERERGGNDPIFRNPDGTKTGLGRVVGWGNFVAENLFDAGFMALASVRWGVNKVVGSAMVVNAADRYFNAYQDTMNQFHQIQDHVLLQNPAIRASVRWRQQLGQNERNAINQVKNDEAKEHASMAAAGQFAKDYMSYRASNMVPESGKSFGVDVAQGVSLNVMADELVRYLQQGFQSFMEQGQLIDAGHAR